MDNFVLKLDLSLYFEDLRKYSCVFVDFSKCKIVGDVENHIKSVFKLDGSICLIDKKCLIPTFEDAQILQHCETVKVQKCDFFDRQIHKSKGPNPVCDQTALNLIQLEKTIDLSCRPKQRIKSSSCRGHYNAYSVPLSPFVERGRTPNIMSPSATNEFFNYVPVCKISTKEKSKTKAQKYVSLSKEENCIENGIDILDMSVTKPIKKRHENCFSTDEGLFESDYKSLGRGSDKNRSSYEIDQDKTMQWTTKEPQKKLKKRKKLSISLEEEFDYPQCDSILSESGSERKLKKKSKKHSRDMIADLSMDSSQLQDEFEGCIHTSSGCKDHSLKKKHKKARKSTRENSSIGVGHEDSSGHLARDKHSKHSSSDTNVLVVEPHTSDKEEHTSRKDLEKCKQMMQMKVDHLLMEVDKVNTNGCSESEEAEERGNIVGGSKEKKAEYSTNTSVSSAFEDKSCDVEPSVNQFTAELDTNLKRKRIRKHNKKKKRERKVFLSAVGPALSNLISQVKQPSEVAKHVFFTDDDFAEEMKIPPTPQNKSQTVISQGLPSVNWENQPSQNGLTWQMELAELASGTSKPLVFHRNLPPTSSDKADLPNASSQKIASQVNLDETKLAEPTLNSCNGITDNISVDLRCNDKVGITEELSEDLKSNLEARAINDTQLRSSPEKTTPDLRCTSSHAKPLLTSLKNIILSNYPIIEKVVAGDLILFKVLKLNDNMEPDMSKPILAKVNTSTIFPGKISLQIMEGREQCDLCETITENSGEFIIELKWTDMLEPRLFYP